MVWTSRRSLCLLLGTSKWLIEMVLFNLTFICTVLKQDSVIVWLTFF
uniref:Uncharacterized protein n=1 Tax=Arundo donax TaxID=35708 RepID=A0A0A9EAL6_ARUDO